MKQKRSKDLQKPKKKGFNNHLIELVNARNKKEEYKYHNDDDLNYFGIKDLENLLINIDDSDYCKPILVNLHFI